MTATPPQRSRSRRPALAMTGLTGIAVVAVAAVGITGALTGGSTGPGGSGGSGGKGPNQGSGIVSLGRTAPVSLTTFSSCDAVKDYFVSHALPLVGPYGLDGIGPMGVAMAAGGAPAAASAAAGGAPVPETAPRAAADSTAGNAAASAGNTGATSQGGTNVQVAGVDEADVSKRVGDLLLTVTSQGDGPALTVLRTTGKNAVVVGRLATKNWYPASLLVDGTTALVIGQGPQPDASDIPGSSSGSSNGGSGPRIMTTIYRPTTRIAQVDLSDPARPTVVRTLDVAGTLSGARLVDGVVRIAVAGAPGGLKLVSPQYPTDGTQLTEQQAKDLNDKATAENKDAVRAAGVEDWLPGYTLTGADGSTSKGSLVNCSDVAAPTSFSGLQTLTLLSTDLRADGLSSWRSAAVVAGDATMYATADRTYLATMPMTLVQPMAAGEPMGIGMPTRTQLHVFDSSGRDGVRYLGGGDVEGTLLNQFSMDEYNGDLRVATTTQPVVTGGGPAPMPMPVEPGTGGAEPNATSASSDAVVAAPSDAKAAPTQVQQSQVTVLRLEGDELTQVGRVGGLGATERIYSVRFIGPVGYVVTFRQTDPLYTLDLSDPTRPTVAGQLKILGYSAYLHPAGDGLLLGVGQDATSQGRTSGLQLSLFDVSNPAAPKRISQVKLPNTYSDAENDHHAFTFADGLVLLPFVNQGAMVTPVPAPVENADGTVDAVPGATSLKPQQPGSGVLAIRLDGRRLGSPTALTFPTPQAGGGGSTGTSSTGASSDGPVPPVAPEYFVVQALRTYVDGGAIWTVTTAGLGIHDEATLRRLGFVAF